MITTVPFKDLLEACIADVTAMDPKYEQLSKNLKYCVNQQELASCLREYIFRSDAKTEAFLKDTNAKVGASLGLVAIRGEDVLALAQEHLKRALLPTIANLKLGQRGKMHIDTYLQATAQQAAVGIQQLIEHAKRLDTDVPANTIAPSNVSA